MKVIYSMENLFLSPIHEGVKGMKSIFNYISYDHVYRKLNVELDSLSREGPQLEVGMGIVLE